MNIATISPVRTKAPEIVEKKNDSVEVLINGYLKMCIPSRKGSEKDPYARNSRIIDTITATPVRMPELRILTANMLYL